MIDSVFSKFLSNQFPRDVPEVPLNRILVDLNKTSERVAKRQIKAIDLAFKELLKGAEPFLLEGNVLGIYNLTSPLSLELQRIYGELWDVAHTLGSAYGIDSMVAAAPNLTFNFNPFGFRNTFAENAVLNRNLVVASDFSGNMINQLKNDLVASIMPQSDGKPISRGELVRRIESNLNVSKVRANAIARTETTAAYTTGSKATYDLEPRVEYIRFLAIEDTRTSEICLSRNGMVILKSEVDLIAMNTPPLHVNCRSVLSPMLPGFNKSHLAMVRNPKRNPVNMVLEPLPKGWRTGGSDPIRIVA